MRKGSAVAAIALSAGMVVTCAGGAAATSIIGAGNAAFNNLCRNTTGPGPQAATTAGSGSATGLAVSIPLSDPANQCGNLGLQMLPRETIKGSPNEFLRVPKAAR